MGSKGRKRFFDNRKPDKSESVSYAKDQLASSEIISDETTAAATEAATNQSAAREQLDAAATEAAVDETKTSPELNGNINQDAVILDTDANTENNCEKPKTDAKDTLKDGTSQQKDTATPEKDGINDDGSEDLTAETEKLLAADPMTLELEDLRQYAKLLREENGQLKALAKQGQVAYNQLMMLKRDFDNFRRRNHSVSENAKEDGKIFVIEKILTVLDTFDRATESLKGKEEENSFAMVYRQFETILSSIGVEMIDVLNKEFDPNTANAVVKEEVDKAKKNIILEVYAKGYRYKDKIVRYAQVKVGV